MNEGCSGGWPLLSGYYGEDFGIPLESCAPYEATTSGHTCAMYKDCPPAVKVEKSGYVGGYYGNANELILMKEIRMNGALSGDL